MSDVSTGLIACPTCKHEIGTQAEKCPQCGSPNSWTHPRIQAMYATKGFGTKRAFRYWHKGAEIWGEATHHSVFAYVCAALILLVAIGSALFTSLLGPAIGGVVLTLFWRATTKKDSFRANLTTGSWHSSDDKFWLPVAVFLGVKQ